MIMSTPDTKIPTVRVVVRARGTVPVGWAGRGWPNVETVHDAVPNEVLDLLKAPQSLVVTWPEDYVAPDGSMPGRVSLVTPSSTAPAATAEERVARAETDTLRAKAAALASEREIAEQRLHHAEELRDLRSTTADAVASATRAANELDAANKRADAAMRHAEEIEKGTAKLLEVRAREHAGAIDTLAAQHLGEISVLRAEHERTVLGLQADLEKATAPANKKGRPAAPAPVPETAAPVVTG